MACDDNPILLHIPSDTKIKSLALGGGKYLSSVFHPFKVDTMSYLPCMQSRLFKDNKDTHDYIMEHKIYLWTDADDAS